MLMLFVLVPLTQDILRNVINAVSSVLSLSVVHAILARQPVIS